MSIIWLIAVVVLLSVALYYRQRRAIRGPKLPISMPTPPRSVRLRPSNREKSSAIAHLEESEEQRSIREGTLQDLRDFRRNRSR